MQAQSLGCPAAFLQGRVSPTCMRNPMHTCCLAAPTCSLSCPVAEEREASGGPAPPANPSATPKTGGEVADGVTANVFDSMFGYRWVGLV